MKKMNLAIVEKMPFEDVDAVQDALFFAFHPDPDDESLDDRFMALWTLFLVSVGWTDQEYWAEWRSRPHSCCNCGKSLNKDGEHADGGDDPKGNQTPPSSKPN